jgi:hypothetical protein
MRVQMRLKDVLTWVFLTAVVAILPLSAGAGEPVRARPIGVVELFTSQGCSSCPKADAALEKLSDRNDVVTVSFHIDYWNYLGWEDTLSAKDNTARQYAYAKTLGNSNVYTPQIVLNGEVDAKSTDPDAIVARLGQLRSNGRGADVTIDAAMADDELTIDIGPGSVKDNGKADVVIAYFNKRTEIDITKGENAGKKIVYRNAVTRLETIGIWEGKALTIKLPAAMFRKHAHDGCAILIQAHDDAGNPGRIYGAAAL